VGLLTEALGARLLGVVCLAYTLQRHRGQRLRMDPASSGEHKGP
jgi:hypothetical protein